MKEIGAEIGVNESRVSQLHARAIRRLRDALGDMNPQQAVEVRRQLVAFTSRKPKMVKAELPAAETVAAPHGVVLPYKRAAKAAGVGPAAPKMGRARQAVRGGGMRLF